jgi:LPXTG-motif cell wall-anchored protein
LADVTNTAVLPAGDTVHAKGLTVSATETVDGADAVSTYGAQSTSGAGGGKVSVAGSLALAVVDQQTDAELAGTVTLTGGDAAVTAGSAASTTVKAEPTKGGVTSTNVGVGASVALALIQDDTTAVLDDGIALTGARNVSLAATASDDAVVEAKMGAAGGKVAVSPAVAIALSNVTTTARLGSLADPIRLSGSLSATATQNAGASSTAGAVTGGASSAAIGIGIGLTIANHTVTGTTDRSIVAGGDVTLGASSVSTSAAAAQASAAGAPESSGSSGAAGDGVDDQVSGQREFADDSAQDNHVAGTGGMTTPSAETSGGKINVAAAIAITIATVTATATIEHDGLDITAGRLVTLASSQNTDAATNADGTASHGSTATVGAAVALTLANVTNTARLPVGDTIHAHSLTVSATETVNGADATSTYGAQSASGAGQGKISVAGSFALTVVNQSTLAELSGEVQLTGGDVAVTAGSDATSTVKAEPSEGGVSASDVGIGASVALNLVTDTTTALLDDDITVTGAHDFAVTSRAGDIASTEAKMGAQGTGSAKVAVTPAIAITISNVTTSATIGTSAIGGLVITGDFSADASQTAGATSSAGAVAAGGSTASVGIALGLNLVTHTVTSTTGRDITAGGSITFQADGSSADGASASASASGAPGTSSADPSDGDVDQQAQHQRDFASTTAQKYKGTGANGSANPSAATSDGKVAVAAAIAINVADVTATATLPDGLTLSAGGAVALRSSENADGIVSADGTAVKAKNVGIGAAVALNLVTLMNTATLGENTTVSGNGFAETATMTAVGADSTHTFSAEADAGAGSQDIGVAGAVALNLVTDTTEAFVPGTAVIGAGSGDVTLSATNLRADSAKAKADAASLGSGKVGVGASVAINVLTTNVTRAEVADGAVLTGGANVALSATSVDPVTNEVTAGSAGSTAAVSPAVGINVVSPITIARLGAPPADPGPAGTADGGLVATGDVSISATHTGSASVTGDAKAAGDGVAVGAVIALNILTVTTSATTLRDVTGASVVLTASTDEAGSAQATASAQGAAQNTAGNADSQASDQLNGTPSTSGTSGPLPSSSSTVSGANSTSNSQSGKAGQGVGVGAAVTVNWVVVHTTASVADDLTITASGAVVVAASNTIDATAKSIGTSLTTNSTNIGAAVGLNVATVTNTGSIGARDRVTAGSVAVEAVTPDDHENDFVVWGLAAAGGNGKASVAGSVGVQVVDFASTAVIGAGSTIASAGGIAVQASNPMGLQNIAAAGGVSLSGSGVGAAIAVNVLTIPTLAYLDSSAQAPTVVDAGGAIVITSDAGIAALPTTGIPLITIDVTSVAVAGGIGTDGVAIGGSVIVDVIGLTTRAFVAHDTTINQNVPVNAGQSLTIRAVDETTFVELAGAIALSGGEVGVGLGLIVNVFDKDVRASLGQSVTARFGGSVSLTATAVESFTELAVDAAASTGVAVVGSFVVLVIDQDADAPGTRAFIDGGTRPSSVHAGGGMSIAASDTLPTLALYTGNLTVGGDAGVGVSSSVLVRTGVVDAGIAAGDDVVALGAPGLAVTATQSENETLLAVGGAASGTAAVSGSATVGVQNDTTHAHLDTGVTVNGDDTSAQAGSGIALAASDTTTLRGVAGQLAVGGSAGVGAGADVEVLNKSTQAWIAPGVAVSVAGDATIDATSSETVTSISTGGAIGGDVGVAVNASVPVFTITTQAWIGEQCQAAQVTAANCAGSRSVVLAGGNARVAATEQLTMTVIAGAIAGGGAAGVGAAAAVPVITKTTSAFLGDFSVLNALGDSAGIGVNTGGFTTTAVDIRFSPAAIASDGVTLHLPFTHSYTEGEQVLYDDGGGDAIGGLTQGRVYYVHVLSPTDIQLSLTPGGAPIALTAPARGGESQRLVPTDKATAPASTSPYFDPSDASGTTIALPYDLDVKLGDAVIYSSGGGAPIGGLVDGGVYYVIPGAAGSHTIELADSLCHADPSATGCDGATQQAIHLDPSVASGRAHSIVLRGDQPSPNAAATLGDHTVAVDTASGFRGVAITANNSDDISAAGVSASFGGGAGVGVGGNVNIVTATTTAFVGKQAQVNPVATGANAAQSVLVDAGNAFGLLMVSVVVAGGSVGVGASAAVGIVKLTTDAFIDAGAYVGARRDVDLVAAATDALTSVSLTGAVGAYAGVAGAASVIVLTTHTYADTALAVTIAAGNNVLIAAHDDTSIIAAGGGAAGGFAGVGIGVTVTSITKDTRAFIGAGGIVDAQATQPDSTLDDVYDGSFSAIGFGASPFNGLAVQAGSSENIFGLAVAVGAGAVGVAGGVDVTLLHADTKAYVDSDLLNRTRINTAAGAGPEQSVNISAADATTALTVGGGVAAGAVGVAGGIDIGIAQTTTQAYIGADATVYAAHDLTLNALAAKSITSYALSVGAALAVGIAASVSVWTIGTDPTTSYNEGANGIDKGTWSASGSYVKGDVVTASDGKRYGALVDDPTLNPVDDTAHTQWEGAADALQPSNGGATAQSQSGDTANGAGAGGYQHILDGASNSTDDDNTNARTIQYLQGAAGTVTVAAPSDDLVNKEFDTPQVPGGTASQIGEGVVIVVGGSVHLRANEQNAYTGVVGSAAVGIVGAGASVAIANLTSNADAGVSAGASITAGGGVSVQSVVTEDDFGIAAGGTGGLVSIGAQVVVITSHAAQNAHIDTGAVIPTAGGTVDVEAKAHRTVNPLAIGIGIGAVAAGAAVADAEVDGDTTATIGDIVIGAQAPAGGVSMLAQSVITVPTEAYSVQGGLGAGITGAGAVARISGTTTAAYPAHSTLRGGMSVAASGTNTTSAQTLGVGTGVLAIGIVVDTAHDDRTTIADVDTGSTVSAGGAVAVSATSANHASVHGRGLAVSAVGATLLLPIAEVTGTTEAHLNGTVSASGSIAVSAAGQNQVQAEADVIGITLLGGGQGTFPVAYVEKSAQVLASIGAAASIDSTGLVSVAATITLDGDGNGDLAFAKVTGGGGGIVNGGVYTADAELLSPTTAELATTVHSSGGVSVTAASTSRAQASTGVGSVAIAGISVSGVVALVAASAATTAIVSGGTISSTGKIAVSATARNTADIDTQVGSFGVFTLSASLPFAHIDAQTRAELGDPVLTANGLEVSAEGHNTATGSSDMLTVAGVTIARAGADVRIGATASVTAVVDSTATTVNAGSGALSVTATSVNTATATPSSGAGGALAVTALLPSAIIGAATTAEFDGGATTSGTFSLEASGQNTAKAIADVKAFGIAAGAGAIADAEVLASAVVVARVSSATSLTASGVVTVSSSLTSGGDSADAEVSTTGGGFLSAGVLFAVAHVAAPVTATFSGTVLASTGARITASGMNAATAKTESVGFGVLTVSGASVDAEVVGDADVEASFGTGALVTTGTVAVKAVSGNSSTAYTDTMNGGAIADATTVPTARVAAGTSATFGGKLTGGTGLAVTAASNSSASSTSGARSIGLAGVSDSSPLAEITADAATDAAVGKDAVLNAPDAVVSVVSTATNGVIALGGSTNGGLGAISNAKPKAQDEAVTSAEFVGAAHGASSTSTEQPAPGASSIQVTASGTDSATAQISNTSVGGLSVANAGADAETITTVKTQFGTSGKPIVTVGDITVGVSSNPVSISSSTSEHVGIALDLAHNKASVTTNPTVTLSIGQGSQIYAGGTITLSATQNTQAPPAANSSEFDGATGVNTTTNVITLTAPHSFTTGSTVTYDAQGGTAVGGLTDGLTYNVIVLGDDTVQLGSLFDGAQIDTSTNTIAFGAMIDGSFVPLNHNLHEGDVVVYAAPSGGATVPGLVSGHSYIVHVVDATHIQLFDPTESQGDVDVTGSDVSGGDTFEVANSYQVGDALTYQSPDALVTFTSQAVDIKTNPDGSPYIDDDPEPAHTVDEDNNEIIVKDHGLTTGEAVVYEGASDPLGGLVNGHTYYVIVVNSNAIQLAATPCEATGGCTDDGDNPIAVTPIALTADKSAAGEAVVQGLWLPGQQPIQGLDDGGRYYVVSASSDGFQVSATPGGDPIDTLDGTDITGIGHFAAAPIELGTGGSTGQQLVLDLTSAGSGTQSLTALGIGAPTSGGGQTSTATVSGSGGGFISSSSATPTANETATMTVTIGANASLTAGGSIELTTASNAGVRADASNGGGGLVAIGSAEGTSTTVTSTVVSVESGTLLKAGHDVTIAPVTVGQADASSRSSAAGLGAGVESDAGATVTVTATTTIAGTITADDDVHVGAQSAAYANVSTHSNAGGLGADSNAGRCGSPHCDIHVTDTTTTDVAPDTHITADNVELTANVAAISVNNQAYTHATALGAGSKASATNNVTSNALLHLEKNTKIVGFESVTLTAEHSGTQFVAHSDASCGCFGGDTDSNATNNYTSDSNVTADETAIIRTGALDVEALQIEGGWTWDRDRDGAVFDGGGKGGGVSNSAHRTIVWNATVYLHAPDPQLIVDSTGTITKLYGVVVKDDLGTTYTLGSTIPVGRTIEVQDIANTGGATVVFHANTPPKQPDGANAPSSTLSGTTGTFTVQNTYDWVKLFNHSSRSMVVRAIGAVNLTGTAATMQVLVQDSSGFKFTVGTPIFTPTLVDIDDFADGGGTPQLVIDGWIDNPIGTTHVDNQHGDILAGPDSPLITTNALSIFADSGTIGSYATVKGATVRVPIPVQLVQSDYLVDDVDPTRFISLVADALDDVVLDITAILRGSPVPFTPTLGPIHAGHDIDLVLGDSLQGSDVPAIASDYIQVNVYNSANAGATYPPTGKYKVYFWPDKTPAPDLSLVLTAFGTTNSPYASTYVFTDLSAGNDIMVEHTATSANLDIDATTNVDATLVGAEFPVPFSTSDGVGEIDIFTNGSIVDTETVGDLRVGTITSTDSDVTLIASDAAGSSIFDVDDIHDGSARVTGNTITLFALFGGIGFVVPEVNPLELRSSNAARGSVLALARDGIYLTQTTGDLFVDTVESLLGDVALTNENGSILDDDPSGAVQVVGANIDLIAHNGAIGADGASFSIDTASDGRLYALTDRTSSLPVGSDPPADIDITELAGPLTVLRAVSEHGSVRLAVPYDGSGASDLTIVNDGETLDGAEGVTQGSIVAAANVLLQVGDDLYEPAGAVIRGAAVTISAEYGQNPAAPVGSTLYFGGTLTGQPTHVFGGAGADTFVFDHTYLGGQTDVYGGSSAIASAPDGDDAFLVDHLQTMTTTHLDVSGDPYDGTQVRDTLHLDGELGDNSYTVTTWGSVDPMNHDYRIEVLNTGALGGLNTLTVNGSNGPDTFLLRGASIIPDQPQAQQPAFVALLHSDVAAERIDYDDHLNARLRVNGLGGDDLFALDDDSSITTINGGDGDDTFIVGQYYQAPRVAPDVHPEDAFGTTQTGDGYVSRGVSFPTTIYGGAGDDAFIVNHNAAELRLEAGTGADTFLFSPALVVPNPSDPTAGAGVFLQNAFVTLDGGPDASVVHIAALPGKQKVVADINGASGQGLNLLARQFRAAPVIVPPATIASLPFLLPDEDPPVYPVIPVVDPVAGDGTVIVTETGGRTIILPGGPTDDTYTIRLGSASSADVYITISVAYGPGEPFALISLDGVTFSAMLMLLIPAGDTSEHTIYVRYAPGTTLDPQEIVETISHSSESDDPAYEHASIANVYVNLQPPVKPVPPTPPAPPVPSGGGGAGTGSASGSGLAPTGSDASPQLALAGLILFGGLVLLLSRRRRRRA